MAGEAAWSAQTVTWLLGQGRECQSDFIGIGLSWREGWGGPASLGSVSIRGSLGLSFQGLGNYCLSPAPLCKVTRTFSKELVTS